MALAHRASFLLTSFGLCLGLFLASAEAASCPATRINVSEICGHVERNDVKGTANLTNLVCDNLQNLSQTNWTSIIGALEFGLRKRSEVQLDIVKVLFNQVDGEELDTALEEFDRKIVNSSLIRHNWKTTILRALWDEKLRNEDRFNETAFVTSWFQKRLRPFVSVISTEMLQCLRNETMQCDQYQAIIKGLDEEFAKMSRRTQEDVFNSFQLLYLKGLNSNGSACAKNLNSTSWLTVNFRRFSRYARYQDLVSLNSRFNALDVLKYLTVKQLGQLSATEGALKTRRDVENLMGFIETSTLTEYIDEFNRQANISLTKEIQASLLQHVLAEAQPIFQEADDAEFTLWMEQRLPGLVPGMNSSLIPVLFDDLENRNCSAINAVVTLLNGSSGTFSNTTRQSIYEAILSMISNSSLRCYSANASFSVFLEETFQGFSDLLTLRDLETLIPASDLQKIVNTIPPDALAELFSREGFLNDDPFLTAVLQNYRRNGLFVDRFNQKEIIDILPNDTKTALLAGVWLSVVSSSNNTAVDMWLDRRLAPYFMFLSGDMMKARETLSASCLTFRKIVGKLNDNIGRFKGREEEVYGSIKAYLTATEAKPRCYNASNPDTSDWLVMYLGSYIRYCSARDVRFLTNSSAATFQMLAFNRDNLELINRNRIRKDLAEMYADALFAVDSNFSLDSLPDQLVCFARRSTRIAGFSSSEALSFIAQVNLHCSSSKPSTSDRQLATMLVAQVKSFDKQTLVALGQQAVGLTTGQISNLTAHDLVDPKVLESLGQVNGWSRGQSQMLVNKILLTNFTLDAAERFERLGTLAQGLPSNAFDAISADSAIGLAKNAGFLHVLGRGPEHLKKAFVNRILSNSSSPSDILNNVPDDLADQVPNSLLVFRSKIPDLRKINEKQWSPQQAAVLFGDVLSSTGNYTELSAFILQGFQCNAASKLTPGQLSSVVQEVKSKHANLSNEQLSCMARLLSRSNLTTDFTSYPRDVLLFFPLDKVDHQNCEAFYSLASQGNLSLLANGSSQRTKLLSNALGCFGVANASLHKEQLRKLGAFVCDMDPAAVGDSDPMILENLKLCPDLTTSQRTALNMRLSSGKTLYGTPPSWGEGTLEDLGPLAFYINRSTWDSIKKEERTIFFKNVVDAYDSQSASQKARTILFLKSVGPKPASSTRTKRAPETCRSAPITTSTLEDPLFIIQYDSAQQFDACLGNEVLKANLAPLLEQPLPNDYLVVMKRKLGEIYPNGIPENQLTLLGFLSRQYSAGEIAKWNVTSSDTLAALLSRDDGAWTMAQLQQLVAKYTELGGTLTGPLLDTLEGEYLCYLAEDQLNQISPQAIRHTEKLDISSCSQGKKTLLYEKARAAFASQEGTSTYYPLIQPYLGGALAEDLKKLARSQVAMDINTFIKLNPEELQKLSVQDVKGLLGVNLPALREAENEPSVATWIRSQFQSELDTLGIGLQGGMPSLSSTAASSSVGRASIATERNDMRTTDTPISPIMGVTVSALSNATTLPTTMRTNAIIPRAATDSLSTSPFKIPIAANKTSTSIDTTNTTVPTTSTDATVAFPTEIPAISSNVTATSNKTIRGTPIPSSARETNTTTSGKTAADLISNSTTSNSTDIPAVATDSTTAVPTEIIAIFSNVTATSDDTVRGIPVFATTRDINMTTSSRNTTDSISTMANITVLPTVPTEIIATSSNVTSTSSNTSVGIPVLPTGTGININTSDETTAAASNPTIATNHATLPTAATGISVTTATNATVSHPLAIGRNHTLSANASAIRPTNITATTPGMTVISSVSPPAPPKPMLNATTATSIDTASKVMDQTPNTTSETTVHSLVPVPPGPAPSRATTQAATPTKRTTSKTPPKTKPTPNGFIFIEPLSASPSNTSLSWLLLTLSLVVGISFQRRHL